MSARADTSPALKGRGSVVTPAKGRGLADGFLGVGPACAPCPGPGLSAGNLDGNGCIKFFYHCWQAAAADRTTGNKLPGLYLFKAPLKSARKNFSDSIFSRRLKPLGYGLLPGAKEGCRPGFSFDGRGFCIKFRHPLPARHKT